MAKKKNDGDNEEKKKSGGKIATILVILGILLIWVVLFAVVIRADVGGIGSSLRPSIKDVPVLNWILPPLSDEELAWEENYPYNDIIEAVDRIKELELEVDQLTTINNEDAKTIAELTAEVERLKVFEENQAAFEERVKEFDKNVVFNSQAPDIEEYKTFYEDINPTTAEEIYRLVLELLQYDEAIQEKANIVKEMKPAQAAAFLEEMTADMDWVAQILLCLKPDQSAAILNKMDQLFVAKVFRKMADMDEEKLLSIQQSLK